MAFMAASSVLGAMGHFANLGQLAEVGQSRIHQKEQMQWAHRAYRLDSRTLRIDLLNAVKEDVRDHYDTYAGRIDTLLLVHTLLLTFALATLQFSDQYVPQQKDACPDCVEVLHPSLVTTWVYLIAAILILPFWCILMLLWCKLKLDGWLEFSVRRLNNELRGTLSSSAFYTVDQAMEEMESVEKAILRLGNFVCEHQDNFAKVWRGECSGMIRATTTLLWVNVVVAVTITAGMFWMFVMNNLEEHQESARNFAFLVVAGLLAPLVWIVWHNISCSWATRTEPHMEQYQSFDSDGDSPQEPPNWPGVAKSTSLSQTQLAFGDMRLVSSSELMGRLSRAVGGTISMSNDNSPATGRSVPGLSSQSPALGGTPKRIRHSPPRSLSSPPLRERRDSRDSQTTP